MSPLFVSVVVVRHNNIPDTVECLDSLMRQSYSNLKITLIDNGSTDDALEYFKEHYPTIDHIFIQENLGFSGGYNRGINHSLESRPDFIFIINNDISLDPDTIKFLVDAAEGPSVGVTAPIIYYYSNPERVWSAGGKISRLSLQMTDNHGRSKTHTHISEKDFLTGCALLIKREVFEQIGIFDDLFRCFFEDSDLCYRIRKAGYRLLLVPQAKIWHKVSVTYGGSDSPVERYWMGRGSILFLKKHAQSWQWIFIIPWRIYSTLKIIVRLLIKRKTQAAGAYLQGTWVGICTKLALE